MVNIHEYAYDTLKKTGHYSLPVDVEAVCSQQLITVLPYSSAKEKIHEPELWEYAETIDGLGMIYNNIAYICYRDDLSYTDRREVIMHECGHFCLNHISHNNTVGKNQDPDVQNAMELEADAFSLAALAPIPLLRQHSAKTVKDIQRLTRMSEKQAKQVLPYLADTLSASFNLIRSIVLPVVSILVSAVILGSGLLAQRNTPLITQEDTHIILQNSAISDNKMFYWTKSGEVYHGWKNCPPIKNRILISGTKQDAEANKDRPCKICIGV